MVKRKKQCWFCLEPFIAKNRRAKFCCSTHRIKYWRWKHKQHNTAGWLDSESS